MSNPTEPATEAVRLDRWLWAARFYKTRQLSAAALKGGKVAHNGRKAKPSRTVRVGDALVIRRDQFRFEVEVAQLRERRVGAELAREMYRETDRSVEQRRVIEEQLAANRRAVRHADGRPDKRDRRLLNRFKRDTAT